MSADLSLIWGSFSAVSKKCELEIGAEILYSEHGFNIANIKVGHNNRIIF